MKKRFDGGIGPTRRCANKLKSSLSLLTAQISEFGNRSIRRCHRIWRNQSGHAGSGTLRRCWLSCLAGLALAIALVVDAITVHALIAYTEGKILSMPAFVVASAILLAFFLLTHGLLVLSAIAVFLRGASRIVLDSEPATIGGRFTGILEIPFPASPAPRFEATLKLMRSVSDSIETGPFASVVWSEKMTLTDWKPAGKKRACAPFRFDLDMPPPDSQPGEYTWDLLIRSIDFG